LVEPASAFPARVARATEGIPGLGGTIRVEPEDFLVEEIPLYEPLGTGDHVVFLLEKRGISTFEALLWLSKSVKVSEHAIGYAGLKDARAVTRQWMSVARVPVERVLAVRDPRVRVLAAARHPSKLRIGHLKGNRFTIRIRGADAARLRDGRAILGRLAERGVPNAYGAQRFGIKGDGHLMGRAILRGDYVEFLSHLLGRPHPSENDLRVRSAREAYDAGRLDEALARFPMKHRIQKKALATYLRTKDAREAHEALGKRPRRIYVSAYQSWLFNRCLDARVRAGTYDRLLEGDLAWLHATGALYRVVDPAAEEARTLRLEASASGPLPGYDMRLPEGEPAALERSILEGEGLSDAQFRGEGVRTRGARRPYRVPLVDGSLEAEDDRTVVARFTLPPGAFATVVLDELMKVGLAASPEDVEADEPGEEWADAVPTGP
jgi:tRNA pseudouridine13 synthase